MHGHVLSIEQARGSLQRRCCRQLQPATRELLGVALRDSSVWEEDRFRKVLEVEGMFRVGRASCQSMIGYNSTNPNTSIDRKQTPARRNMATAHPESHLQGIDVTSSSDPPCSAVSSARMCLEASDADSDSAAAKRRLDSPVLHDHAETTGHLTS